MAYISTRGEAPKISFTEALLAGLAPDGGLYVPEAMPRLSREDNARLCRQRPMWKSRETVISPFLEGTLPPGDFRAMLEARL